MRTGTKALSLLLALMVFAATLAPPSAQAQEFYRASTLYSDGEPTDPDGALALLDDADVDLGAYGLSATSAEDDVDSWFEALLNLLHTLGLIPEGDSD